MSSPSLGILLTGKFELYIGSLRACNRYCSTLSLCEWLPPSTLEEAPVSHRASFFRQLELLPLAYSLSLLPSDQEPLSEYHP